MTQPSSWVGFDFDATLVTYDESVGVLSIGRPIPTMVEKLKGYLRQGQECRIFTARVFGLGGYDIARHEFAKHQRDMIRDWCLEHIGIDLQITCVKDFGCIRIYDDRCVQVEPNTGVILGKE